MLVRARRVTALTSSLLRCSRRSFASTARASAASGANSSAAAAAARGGWVLVAARPRLYVWDNFLSAAECDALRLLSTRHLAPTHIEDGALDTATRAADGCWLPRADMQQVPVVPHAPAHVQRAYATTLAHPTGQKSAWASDAERAFVARIEQRMARRTGAPVAHGEPLQVLRYSPGGHYRQHPDFFFPGDAALQMGGQRVGTLMVYLTSAVAAGHDGHDAGGATRFPHAHAHAHAQPAQAAPAGVQWETASQSGATPLSVLPRAGRAVLWWNVQPSERDGVARWPFGFRDTGAARPRALTGAGGDGSGDDALTRAVAATARGRWRTDEQSRHESTPLRAGEKWVVTKWLRQREFPVSFNAANDAVARAMQTASPFPSAVPSAFAPK